MHINHSDYDRIIIFFSGKDSLCCLLKCIEMGIPVEKMELWHHLVDGDGPPFIDWPCSGAYAKAIGKAFGIPCYHSWREGGFRAELLRENRKSAATYFETPDGLQKAGGDRGKLLTRRSYPFVGKIESGRWCSALEKVDVSRTALNNQERFNNSRTLTISGERAQESATREGYAEFECHECDARDGSKKRWIDRCRLVHKLTTEEVWQIIANHKINPHPCYRAGFGRCSCGGCIFSNEDQIASYRVIMPSQFQEMYAHEKEFEKSIHFKAVKLQGETIYLRDDLKARADRGVPYTGIDLLLMAELLDKDWSYPVFLKNWQMPLGAFASQVGPT